MMLSASVVISACSSDDPLSDLYDGTTPQNYQGNNMNGGNQNSTSDGSSELLSFDVLIDRTTAEPATTASATYPEQPTTSARTALPRLSTST